MLRYEPSNQPMRYRQWINDAETNQWRGVYHPTSEEQARTFLAGESKACPERLTLAITNHQEQFLGLIGLRSICWRSRRAEIWIYIGAKTQWGKGIGTDAIGTLCDYAFDEMNLHRIWLECDLESIAATRCYEKNGFRREGILKDGYYRHGKYRDTLMMGLVKTDRDSKNAGK